MRWSWGGEKDSGGDAGDQVVEKARGEKGKSSADWAVGLESIYFILYDGTVR